MLALNFGLYWTGLSLGPLIGNAALKVTGNILSVFYIAIALQAAFLAYTRLIMVEPLSQEQQRQARANWKLAHDDAHSALQGSGLLAKLWSPISPIFRPLEAIKPTWKTSTGSALAQPRRDWNLFLAAVGLGTLYIIAVSDYSCSHLHRGLNLETCRETSNSSSSTRPRLSAGLRKRHATILQRM